MKPRVLIIGAEGMLGSEITRVFSTTFSVTASDKPQLDITNERQVVEKVSKLKPEFIINTAAFNGADQAEEDEGFKLAELINDQAVGYLAKAAQEVGATIIHFSTDYVFDGKNTKGYDEQEITHPINKYGQTKAAGERALMKNTEKFYLVRLSRLFGPPGKSQASKKSFVESILSAASLGKELSLVSDEFSCATYSPDLARLVLKLVRESWPYGTYHGPNSGAANWLEFAEEIFKLKKLAVKARAVKSVDFKRAAQRPAYSELLNTKLPPQRSWQEALGEFLSV